MGAHSRAIQDAGERRVFEAPGREGRHRRVAGNWLWRIWRGLRTHCARGKRTTHPPGGPQRASFSGQRARAAPQRRSARNAALTGRAGVMRTQPLKVGVAGLGTVGTALVSQIASQRDALAARCGRLIEVVAVSARSRSKDRGIDLKKMKWATDPVSLAREPGIDVFVELIGGAGDPAKGAVEMADRKSTRLNSSHMSISYAVFCLKK